MHMISTKTPSGNSGMRIPCEGINDMNGHLFHHSSLKAMMPVGVERLREHGINYEGGKHFTQEEDALIMQNWEDYRLEHHLEKMDIFRYAGFGGARGRTTGDLYEFRRASHMWPRMCRGLESRCAGNVRQRIVRTFHSRIFPLRAFTPEDDVQLQQLLKRFAMAAVCDIMRRSFGSLESRSKSLQNRQMFAHSERRRLWNTVVGMKPTGTRSVPEPDDKVVGGRFRNRSADQWNIPKPDGKLWTEVSRALFRCKNRILQEWNTMVVELQSIREEDFLTFDEALNKVAPVSSWISAADFSEFVEIFLEEVPKMETFRMTVLQKENIKKNMKRFGITGFQTGRLSEFTFCRYRLGRMLSALRRNLLRPASLRLSLSTQLRLLSRCLRSLPGAEKNQRFVLRRSHVIREIGKQLTSENPDWKLSRKLRRYIEGEKE